MSDENTIHKTGWIAGVSAVAALLAALGVNQFFPEWVARWTSPNSYSLNFDGVYREVGDNNEVKTYVRFYPDGRVLLAPVEGGTNAGKVVEWFDSSSPAVAEGHYVQLEDGLLEFSVTALTGQVDYTGKIDGNHLELNAFSRINGTKSTDNFEFIQAKGLRE